jgi:hypothetical protein
MEKIMEIFYSLKLFKISPNPSLPKGTRKKEGKHPTHIIPHRLNGGREAILFYIFLQAGF